ncbi:UPF0149 family protein [Thiomicrorhabdus aquaedulcis]|uniref:UPF0149 family protein n=1 Tax=Thiomicrorhabdus aquaedulcis TaxID=2211106 RepID=UPI000FDBEBD1|nr:UPF0149 family protein [Thiomicrorhabdus aquaedulcis]
MDFDQVNEVIAPFPELESPAFIQGMLLGLLCADSELNEAIWLKKLIEEAQIKSVKESFLKALHAMFETTNKGLNGSGFELELCLPDDAEPLVFRAAMLGQLCEGVLYGLGLVGRLNDDKNLPPEVRELISDFSDVARIDVDGLAALSAESTESSNSTQSLAEVEEAESDFVQLIEFVRVGILMMNEELNPVDPAPIEMDESFGKHLNTVH